MKGYKLFRIKGGKLFPLYVNANKETPVGTWLPAECGELKENGKVKSRLGDLCYRPGWHCSEFPVALHIGQKKDKRDKLPSFRPVDQVWAEVEVSDSVDWQSKADEAGNCPRDKQLKEIPVDGYYKYKTTPSMFGTWVIAGAIRVNKVLTDEEVREINSELAVDDLPRATA